MVSISFFPFVTPSHDHSSLITHIPTTDPSSIPLTKLPQDSPTSINTTYITIFGTIIKGDDDDADEVNIGPKASLLSKTPLKAPLKIVLAHNEKGVGRGCG